MEPTFKLIENAVALETWSHEVCQAVREAAVQGQAPTLRSAPEWRGQSTAGGVHFVP